MDPLGAGPMPALGALLASPATEIVLHDAANDLKSLRTDYGWSATRVFDTRIAAQLLGMRAFGLASLLADLFGVKLAKKEKLQRADWSMRPLTAEMLAYAAQDTAHLLALCSRLRADLERAGRLAWAEEEFAALEHPVDVAEREPAFLRVKGAHALSARSLTALRDLVAWRDGIARQRDKAPFRIIGNEQLLAIAGDPPHAVADLARVRGASPALLRERGAELVDVIARVRALPDADLVALPRSDTRARDPALEARIGRLKAARDAAAAKLGLDPGFIFGRGRLEAVALARPRTLDELARVDGVRRWIIDVMGQELVAAAAR